MTRIGSRIHAVAAVLVLCSCIAVAAAKPDVVVFLTDDQGRLDASPYGSPDLPTPNMQRLSEAGMLFSRAYVASPSCAPSRAAMLTGLMPARNGAQANHSRPRADIKKWPAYFHDLGYEVVAFGKVSHYKHTAEYGFDYFAHDTYHDDVCVTAALAWLNARDRNSTRPLCFMVGTNWPHVPWPNDTTGIDPASLRLPAGSVDTPMTRRERARYAAAVRNADRDLGLIYDASRKLLGDDTIFLFSGDNGAQWPFGKWNCYESGVGVPLIVAWKGVVKPGSQTDAIVSWVDFLPTLLEAVGGDAPAGIDGKSFLPVLRGDATAHRDRIFTTHTGDGRFNVYPIRALRVGQWKYILNVHPEFAFTTHLDLPADSILANWMNVAKRNKAAAAIVERYFRRPPEELYNLDQDPNEQVNLANDPKQKERLQDMRTQVQTWIRDQGDTIPLAAKPRLLAEPSSYGPGAK